MKCKCAFSGSGGQGAALMAKLTCMACITENKQVVMTQTYGVEQRGGDSTGFVVISDEAIGNPIVENDADIGVALSESIYPATLSGLKQGGTIFVNSSMVKNELECPGVKQVHIPVSELAHELGDLRVANVIMLGAVLKATNILKLDSVIKALSDSQSNKKKANLLELNIRALNTGAKIMEEEGIL